MKGDWVGSFLLWLFKRAAERCVLSISLTLGSPVSHLRTWTSPLLHAPMSPSEGSSREVVHWCIFYIPHLDLADSRACFSQDPLSAPGLGDIPWCFPGDSVLARACAFAALALSERARSYHKRNLGTWGVQLFCAWSWVTWVFLSTKPFVQGPLDSAIHWYIFCFHFIIFKVE